MPSCATWGLRSTRWQSISKSRTAGENHKSNAYDNERFMTRHPSSETAGLNTVRMYTVCATACICTYVLGRCCGEAEWERRHYYGMPLSIPRLPYRMHQDTSARAVRHGPSTMALSIQCCNDNVVTLQRQAHAEMQSQQTAVWTWWAQVLGLTFKGSARPTSLLRLSLALKQFSKEPNRRPSSHPSLHSENIY